MAQQLQERVITAQLDRSLLARMWPPWWAACLVQDIADLRRFRHVLRNFVVTDLKTRYQRSALGFLWTMLHPVMMMTVLAIVFSQVMRWDLGQYALYLFSGLIPWQFFSSAVSNGSNALLVNEQLIKRIEVPKFLFPLNCVLVAGVNMFFEIVALFIMFNFFGATLHVQIILFPVGIVFLGVFSLGIAMIAMTLLARFRDFQHIITILLQAIYFACPILYERKFIEKYPAMITFNPMAYILEFFQDAFYYGVWPSWQTWVVAPACAVAAFLLGYIIYKHCEPSYVFWL